MKYAYYPGCSLHSMAKEYEVSFRSVCEKTGIELEEPKKWICCGSSYAHAASKLLGISLAWYNFIEINKLELKDVIAPCAACFSRFKTAQAEVENEPETAARIEDILESKLPDGISVFNPLEIFLKGNLLNEMAGMVKRDLSGIKIACYYGCLLTRPPKITQSDDYEYPQSMDTILNALGIETIDWSYKTECCGASFSLTRTDIVLKLTFNILEDAKLRGADAIAVACPLCHANLDMRQKEIEKKYERDFKLPVFYFSELMDLSLGASEKELLLKRHLVSVKEILSHV